MLRLKNEVELKVLADKIPQNNAFISVAEAGVLFGILKRTLYRLVHKGKIQSVNLGIRLVRIDRSAMGEMLPLPAACLRLKAHRRKNYTALRKMTAIPLAK
jgi:excisionase family DNA binding protein